VRSHKTNKKENPMRATHISLTLAALGLGTALVSATAFAQNVKYPVGRAANDGGMVAAQSGGERSGSASNTQAARLGGQGGNVYAFGRQGQPAAPQSHYPMGRAANDGGMVAAQAQQGGTRSGSASNERATRGPGETYAAGAQPQGKGLYNSAAPYKSQQRWSQ
jgi:hypothetical protein